MAAALVDPAPGGLSAGRTETRRRCRRWKPGRWEARLRALHLGLLGGHLLEHRLLGGERGLLDVEALSLAPPDENVQDIE